MDSDSGTAAFSSGARDGGILKLSERIEDARLLTPWVECAGQAGIDPPAQARRASDVRQTSVGHSRCRVPRGRPDARFPSRGPDSSTFLEGRSVSERRILYTTWGVQRAPDPEFAIYFESPVELHRLNGLDQVYALVWMNEEDGPSDATGRIYFDVARPPWNRPLEIGEP